MSILKINKYNNEVKMSEDYKQVTFSDGKRKTYEKIIKEKTSLICKAKICNNVLSPDYTSKLDKRYCLDCMSY